MSAGFDFTVYEGSLDGRVIGNYHHDGSNDLAGPKQGDIIELEGRIGHWRVSSEHPLTMHHPPVEPQGTGQLVVERVDDKLIESHGE
jgi:hypothetical protein